jgi:hypothetical protein
VRRRPIALAAGFAAVLSASLAGTEAGWASGKFVLPLDRPGPLEELEVRGVNGADAARTVVLRIDDRPGAPYWDRVGEERLLPPGPFDFKVRLGLLETPRHRRLDLATASRAIGFSDDPRVEVLSVSPSEVKSLPAGVLGWFMGPPEAVPLGGFEAIAEDDPRVSGAHGDASHGLQVRRFGTDPILSWGTRLTRLTVALPNGRWHVALWTEDPGAWETLPPVLERRIMLNGVVIDHLRRDWAGWVRERYMAGRDLEADASKPPFASVGARRGGRIEALADVTDGHLRVDLAGYPTAAINLSALVAEPAEAPRLAVDAVESARASAFASAWPAVGATPRAPRPASPFVRADGPSRATAAPGGIAFLRFVAASDIDRVGAATVNLPGLDTRLWWGMWRWRRRGADTRALELSASHLRADVASVPVGPRLPRNFLLAVRVPADAAPGTRRGEVLLDLGGGKRVSARFDVDVVGVHRPEPRQKVGPFLDFAPWLAGDRSTLPDARRQAACDLRTLRWFGFTAVAPPLEDPVDAERTARFVEELGDAEREFGAPLEAYAPLRHMAIDMGRHAAADRAAAADAAARAAGLVPPAWMVADEPTSSGTMENARVLVAEMHRAAPGARLAAHLNAAGDAVLLGAVSMATTNPGFGAGRADVARIRAAGTDAWLYNMPSLRLGAGFHLWASGAGGMLQWHARMPTADAFDPTDGREGDVQFLWPTPGVCGAADIDADLVELAEGEEDLRWMAWLEAVAPADAHAAALLADFRSAFPGDWASSSGVGETSLVSLRSRVLALASRQTRARRGGRIE